MAVRRRPLPTHAFVHRAGVRLDGTNITCDAAGSATDLVFLSHAQAVGTPGRRRFPVRRAGRQELLATERTLALLGRAGEGLRRHALPAGYGRPFVLGDGRVELVPSGHLPGSASLLCEIAQRRLLYAGAVNLETPGFGAEPAEIRRADALCIDGTFGHPRFAFPPRAEALAEVRAFVRDCHAEGRAPVLLVAPFGPALEVAAALAADGVSVRGHRSVVNAATAFRAIGVPAPLVARFERKLDPTEALLWPPELRGAPLLGVLERPCFALLSGDEDEGMRRIPLADRSGHRELLAYIKATGAREVAVTGTHAEELAGELRGLGLQAYALGPPRQMELPGEAAV
jgi:putative mRNA 3-end processing factor